MEVPLVMLELLDLVALVVVVLELKIIQLQQQEQLIPVVAVEVVVETLGQVVVLEVEMVVQDLLLLGINFNS